MDHIKDIIKNPDTLSLLGFILIIITIILFLKSIVKLFSCKASVSIFSSDYMKLTDENVQVFFDGLYIATNIQTKTLGFRHKFLMDKMIQDVYVARHGHVCNCYKHSDVYIVFPNSISNSELLKLILEGKFIFLMNSNNLFGNINKISYLFDNVISFNSPEQLVNILNIIN
jgi:hypothetical protein